MTGVTRPRDYSGWYLSVIAVGFVAIVVGLAYQYYRGQREQLLTRAGDGLRTAAELKVSQVQRWRQERISDGEWLRDSMPLAWVNALAAGPEDPARRVTAEQWLELIRTHHRARRALLFDASRRLLLARPAADYPLARHLASDLDLAAGAHEVRLGDLGRDAESRTIFQALCVPLGERVRGGGAPALAGILVLELDPAEFLFPMIQRWPTPSQSGETLLVRRDGAFALFLNDLRHRRDSALQLRVPLAEKMVPAVRAIAGETGLMFGSDYRGESVLAYALPVAGTTWHVVAKEDLREVEAPLRALARNLVTTAVLLMLLTGATAGFVWRGHARHVDRQEQAERQHAADTVQQSESQLRSLLGAMTEMVVLHEIVADANGRAVDYRILDCNAAFSAATGIPRDKAVGALASVLYGSGVAPYLEEYAAVAATGVPKRFEVYFPPLKKYFEISAFSPQIGRFGTVTSDITERRQNEEELARLNRELTSKNKELEDIIYVASHDLRAPLINVLGFGERLSKELPALLAPTAAAPDPPPQLGRAERALGHIRASAMRMDALLRGLLRVSRLGREELRPARLDAAELVRGVLASLAHQIEEAGAGVTVGALPACRGDAQQIGQVFANLIDNALKYRAADRRLVLQITGQVAGGEAVYCFADNGPGIAPGHQERIWEMFHRLNPTGAVAGEGLGLCIVRRIVIRHQGRVWVESALGEGSRFFVALPAAD